MSENKQTRITKDAGKKQITIIREFNAPLEQVWDAWTKKELLDEWWAPRPWHTKTKSMDFCEGGLWLYAMKGPEDEENWVRVDFNTIDMHKNFTADDAFCDANGNITANPPGMHWSVEFTSAGKGTSITTVITFATEKDMETIIEMGFEEGFTSAHGNLDEMLAAKTV